MALISPPFVMAYPALNDCPVSHGMGGTLNILHAVLAVCGGVIVMPAQVK
jgi:hypothetical protein